MLKGLISGRVLASGLFFCLISVGSAMADSETSAISSTRIHFELTPGQSLAISGGTLPVEGTLTLTPATRDAEPIALAVSPGQELVAEVPANSLWRARLEAPGFWSPATVVAPRPGSREEVIPIPIWRVGRIAGEVRVEDNEPRPEKLTATFSSPPGSSVDQPLGKHSVDCPVDAKRRFVCELPELEIDLSLRARGFISHYFWSVEVKADEDLPLGPLKLKRGASLAGWAVAPEGELREGEGTARLFRRTSPGGGVGSVEERLRKTALEEKLRENGFFHFEGIAPGSYALEVEHPGFANAQLAPVEIYPDAETRLGEPLELRAPVTLEIAVSPARDWRGQPWQLQVSRASVYSSNFDSRPLFDQPILDGGIVRIPDQSPGLYAIFIQTAAGDRVYHDRNWIVDNEADAVRRVALEFVEIQGEVRWGDEPLAAKIFFGGRHGAMRAALKADDEGQFEGILPREGLWRVVVVAEEAEIEAELRVEVRSGERLEIELPDTEVFGRVVDRQGRPVTGARVGLSAPSGSGHGASSGEDGEFTFRAVPAKVVALNASIQSRGGTLMSDTVVTPVEESIPAGPFELRLRHGTKPFSGRVFSARGPVAGATVWAEAVTPGLGGPGVARTGLDGGFNIQIPDRANQLRVTVLPPGHSLQVFVVDAAAEPVVFEVHDVGGLLEISWAADEEAQIAGRQVVVLQGGQLIANQLLLDWARGHGELPVPGNFRIPRLALGEYTVCFHDPGAAGRAVGAGASWLDALQGCQTGYLGYGQELRLEPGSGR